MAQKTWNKVLMDWCWTVLLLLPTTTVGSVASSSGDGTNSASLRALCPVAFPYQRSSSLVVVEPSPRDATDAGGPGASFWIDTGSDKYSSNTPLTVNLTGSRHFQEFVLQVVSTADGVPLGTWSSLPTGAQTISCSQNADAVTYLNNNIDSTTLVGLVWTPDVAEKNIQFVANVLEADGTLNKIASGTIQPDTVCNCPLASHNTDVQPVNSVQETGAAERHNSRPKRDTEAGRNSSVSTVATTKTTTEYNNPDVKDLSESLFLLATIIGAYVGMYTVFAFLIL